MMSKKGLFVLFFCFLSSFCLASPSLEEKLQTLLHYSEEGPNRIGYLYIPRDKAIDQATYLYVKLATEYYKKQNVCCILLHLDTPGGEVFSAMQIADLLRKSTIEEKIPVLAVIDSWAVSAGALLAYSCPIIGTTNTSIMGAAEPVIMKGGEMESASEKVNSALRAEFANAARYFGRDPLLAEAMVDKDITLVMRKGKILQVEESEVKSTDEVITKKGKLLTLDGKDLQTLGVSDFFVEKKAASSADKQLQEGSLSSVKNLVWEEPHLAKIPNVEMLSYQDWRIDFFSFLSHPAISSLLVLGLIVGIYIEINTPGFGVAGSIAIGCLCLILLSSFAIKAVSVMEIIILFAGLILLSIELFVLPTFGFLGIVGICLTLAGLFLLLLPHMGEVHFAPLFSEGAGVEAKEVLKRLAWFSASILSSFFAISFVGRFLSGRSFFRKRFVSLGEQESSLGYVAGKTEKELPKIGEKGKTRSILKPFGKVEFAQGVYDAFSERGFLDENIVVFVYKVEGSKIIVRRVEEQNV